jgi:ferredoxin/flavodoxin---NADP+ reductase
MEMKENATLMEKKSITEDLAIFKIKLDNPIKFMPGQYVTIATEIDGKPVGRPYSISSSPNNHDIIEIYVKLIDNGSFTPKLFQLEKNSRMIILPVKGRFVYEQDERNIVMIASGTGLGPYISFLKHIEETGCNKHGKIILIHGVSYESHLAYRDYLESLGKNNKINFIYLPTLSRPSENKNWKGLIGRAEAILEGEKLKEMLGLEFTPEKTSFYLCGHPKMIENCINILTEKGFKKALDIHFERYWVE